MRSQYIHEMSLDSSFLPLSSKGSELLASFDQGLTAASELCSRLGDRQEVVLFLHQVGTPCAQSFADWQEELDDQLWLDTLYERIVLFRALLRRLRALPATTVYLAESSCFDLFFDIALTCDHRFASSESIQFGYPDIALGGFPVGGIFEQLVKLQAKSFGPVDAWQSKGRFFAKQAQTEGLITMVVPSKEPKQTLINWLAQNQLNRSHPPATPLYEEPHYSKLDPAILSALQQRWVKRYGIIAEFPKAWRTCSALASERLKGFNDTETGSLTAYLCARFMLSRSYIEKLRLSAQGQDQPVQAPDPVEAFKIDLSGEVPPVRVLDQLFQRRIAVLFYCEDVNVLRAGLDIIYNRLERLVGGKQAADYWDAYINWYDGGGGGSNLPTLRFAYDDTLTLESAQGSIVYFRLSGNKGRAGAGWLERLSEGSLPPICAQDLIESIHDGIIEPQKTMPEDFPVTLLVRSLFLEEMIAAAGSQTKGFDGLVEALKAEGWVFAGDDVRWERFLLHRQHFSVALRDQIAQLGVHLRASIWQLGPLKEARLEVKRHPQKSNLPDGSSHILYSRHLALYAFKLVNDLTNAGVFSSLELADQAVSQAIGFPSAQGSALTYARRLGHQRWQAYQEKYWQEVKS